MLPDSLRLYTTADVAALFGIGRDSATRWAREGRWGAFQLRTVGGRTRLRRWRFRAELVDADLAAGTPPPPPPHEPVEMADTAMDMVEEVEALLAGLPVDIDPDGPG